MLPLLGGRLVGVAGDRLSPDFADAVGAALAHDRAAAMARQAQARDVAAVLADRDIAALPLKGPWLAARVHGDVGLRSPGDVDVLVAERDLRAAVAALHDQGYAPPADEVDRAGRPRLHFTLRHPALATVELHWRMYWYEHRFSADMLSRARRTDDGVLAPDPLDEVAALLVFFARDGFHGVRLAADIAAWSDRHGAGPRDGLLDGHVERYPHLARVWRAAARATGFVTGVPARTWVSTSLHGDRRSALAVRLGSWSGRGDIDQLAANMDLADGLLAPSLERFVLRVYNEMPNPGAHMAKRAARFAVALWRVRREPWDPLPPRA